MKTFDIKKHKGKFFEVLQTTDYSQIAAITIKPGEDSGGGDIHEGDQVVYVLEGEAEVEMNGKRHKAKTGEVFIIPAKTEHTVYSVGKKDLFLLNVYAPPAY